MQRVRDGGLRRSSAIEIAATVILTVFPSLIALESSGLCKSRTLSKLIFTTAAALFDVGVTRLYLRLRPTLREFGPKRPCANRAPMVETSAGLP